MKSDRGIAVTALRTFKNSTKERVAIPDAGLLGDVRLAKKIFVAATRSAGAKGSSCT